jgi:hypothetical protein
MLLDHRLDRLYKQLISQWNIAERRIKKAEQVCENEVIVSAVFELRYAGRKMVDAQLLLLEKDWKNDQDEYENICRFLSDAIEDCIKAKHDAIDAMLDFVTIWFKETEKRIGLHRLIEIFPNYIEVTAQISTVQHKIARSREDRVSSRDSLYDEIEIQDYDHILQLYDKMRISRDRIQHIASYAEWRDRILTWGTVIMTIGAVIVVIDILVKFWTGGPH